MSSEREELVLGWSHPASAGGANEFVLRLSAGTHERLLTIDNLLRKNDQHGLYGEEERAVVSLTPAHQAALAHNLAANLPRREQLELVYRLLGVELELYPCQDAEQLCAFSRTWLLRWRGDKDWSVTSGLLPKGQEAGLAACCVRAMLDG